MEDTAILGRRRRASGSAWSALVLVGAVVLVGCPLPPFDGQPRPDEGGPRRSGACMPTEQCGRDIDCAAGGFCEGATDEQFGCCVASFCLADDDCAPGLRCDNVFGTCYPDDLCDPEVPGATCGPDEVCLYLGEARPTCLPLDEVPPAQDCLLEPAALVTRAGSPTPVRGVAQLASGAPAPHRAVTLSSSLGDVEDGLLVGRCEEGTVCHGTLRGNTGAGVCEAPLWVFPVLGEGHLRAVVVGDDGLPLEGAHVRWTVDTQTLDTQTVDAVTDVDGQAAPDVAAAVVRSVTAWADGYVVQTLVTDEPDVLVRLRRRTTTPLRAVSGGFDRTRVAGVGNLEVLFAGVSHGGPAHELQLSDVLGVPVGLQLSLPGLSRSERVHVGSGLGLYLEGEAEKGTWMGIVTAGPRLVWSLGSKRRVDPLFDLLAWLLQGAEDGANPLWPLGELRGASHGLEVLPVTEPLELPEGALQPGEPWPPVESYGSSVVVEAAPRVYALRHHRVRVPRLPCGARDVDPSTAGCMDYASGAFAVVVVVAADVPVWGQVPLGLAGAADDRDPVDGLGAQDGLVNVPGLPPGEAMIGWAPPHSGLEGQPQIAVALAVTEDDLARGLDAAAVVVQPLAAGASFDAIEPPFLALPAAQVAPGGAEVVLWPVPGADAYELILDEGAAPWEVWTTDADPLDLQALWPAELGPLPTATALNAYAFDRGQPRRGADVLALGGVTLDRLGTAVSSQSRARCVDGSDDGPSGCRLP